MSDLHWIRRTLWDAEDWQDLYIVIAEILTYLEAKEVKEGGGDDLP